MKRYFNVQDNIFFDKTMVPLIKLKDYSDPEC